jgi:hypothetical protein
MEVIMKFWSNNSDVEYFELYELQDIHFMLRYSPAHDNYSMEAISTSGLEEFNFSVNSVDDYSYFDSDRIKEFHDTVGII